MSNQIRVIHPYWHEGALVFDDATVGLSKEPFVAGADDALRALAAQVGESCEERFTLYFSDEPFPGYQAVAIKTRPEYGGNWYEIEGTGQEGWLCPALYRYYTPAPERLYIQIRPRGE